MPLLTQCIEHIRSSTMNIKILILGINQNFMISFESFENKLFNYQYQFTVKNVIESALLFARSMNNPRQWELPCTLWIASIKIFNWSLKWWSCWRSARSSAPVLIRIFSSRNIDPWYSSCQYDLDDAGPRINCNNYQVVAIVNQLFHLFSPP